MMVLVYAVVGVVAALLGVLPWSSFALPTAEERRAATAIVLLAAWPLLWTFLLGPLLIGNPPSPLFPLLWFAPALCWSVTMLAHNVNTRGFVVDPPVVLIASQSLLTLLFVIWEPKNSSEILRWLFGAILLLMVVIKERRVTAHAVAVGCRASLALVACVVLATVLVNPAAVAACRMDKCDAAGRVLTSPFAGNGNILGLSVAMLLPFALLGRSAGRSFALVSSVLAVGELAGSRSAFIGVGVVVVLHAALRFARGRARSTVLAAGLLGSLALSLAPALLSYDDQAFSFRGELWNDAKALIHDRPILGGGPTTWEKFGETSIIDANYSPHNAWLDMTVSVGLLGVAIIVCAMALKVYLLSGPEREAVVVYLCGLLGASTLESLFVPYFLGIAPFVAIIPLLIGPGSRVIGGSSAPVESPAASAESSGQKGRS